MSRYYRYIILIVITLLSGRPLLNGDARTKWGEIHSCDITQNELIRIDEIFEKTRSDGKRSIEIRYEDGTVDTGYSINTLLDTLNTGSSILSYQESAVSTDTGKSITLVLDVEQSRNYIFSSGYDKAWVDEIQYELQTVLKRNENNNWLYHNNSRKTLWLTLSLLMTYVLFRLFRPSNSYTMILISFPISFILVGFLLYFLSGWYPYVEFKFSERPEIINYFQILNSIIAQLLMLTVAGIAGWILKSKFPDLKDKLKQSLKNLIGNSK